MDTGARRARVKPRRATAARQQSWFSCSQAPRPGSLVEESGTRAPLTLATRSSADRGAAARQPTQVRLVGPRVTSCPEDRPPAPPGEDADPKESLWDFEGRGRRMAVTGGRRFRVRRRGGA